MAGNASDSTVDWTDRKEPPVIDRTQSYRAAYGRLAVNCRMIAYHLSVAVHASYNTFVAHVRILKAHSVMTGSGMPSLDLLCTENA